MTKDRVDYKPHLLLLSLSHISGTFIFKPPTNFGKQGIIRTKRHLNQGSKETTACNFEKNRARGLFWRIGNKTTISEYGKQCCETVLTALSKIKRKPVGTADHKLIQ